MYSSSGSYVGLSLLFYFRLPQLASDFEFFLFNTATSSFSRYEGHLPHMLALEPATAC